MSGIKENKTYDNQSAISASFGVGKILQDIKQKQSMPKLPNVQMPQSQAGGYGEGERLPLGTVTTGYEKSTKFEPIHPGIDIGNTIGTPIKSFSGGKVVESQIGKKQGDLGYGNYVVIEDPKTGNRLRYSHLDQALVKINQQVTPGMQIGTMGNTGQTYSIYGGTGSHLDLRVYQILNAYKKYIDPSIYLREFYK